MRLYHVGFSEIKTPDLKIGRKNADFAQGFYLSNDLEFSYKWAKTRIDSNTYLNTYELDITSLNIKEFKRDNEWFNYIFKNRNNYEDELKDYDVIIGPIANDTIYNTWGILTSGYVSNDKALEVLTSGPIYYQVVIKTEKALNNLKFISSIILDKDKIKKEQLILRDEEENYQGLLLKILNKEIKKIFK